MTALLPSDSALAETFQHIINQRKIVFLAGLPGVGKSLLLREMVLLAQDAGRTVDMLQWDVTRAAFETADLLSRYPEVDGITHAAIRKAVGVWARDGVQQWHMAHAADDRLLLGEVPLIGNRLIELVQVLDDGAEALLSSPGTLFVVPVPSVEVRRFIEEARARTIAAPQHERENRDAPPNVLQMMWGDVAQLGRRLGLAKTSDDSGAYDPAVYAAVYRHLLQHRHYDLLPVETILASRSSAYAFNLSGRELAATPAEVAKVMEQIEEQHEA